MKLSLPLLAAALFATPGPSAHRSPGPGIDVYRPANAQGRVPAVLVAAPRGGKQAAAWGKRLAASGLAAVVYRRNVSPALAYVRAHAARLGVDPGRICTLGFSTRGAAQLAVTLRAPRPWLRCNVVYYAPLAFAPRRSPGLLVVKAGRDSRAVRDSIDRFAAEARELHADVRLVENAGARPGFDVSPRTARSRAVVRHTLRFLKARLARPLTVETGCATRAERRSVLRFFASDDTPLAGVVVGKGARGVVLAHQIDGNLCDWLPYARQLAAAGHRVLAFNSRRPGVRVDLDVAAAVEALRRTGSEHVVAAGSSLGASGVLIGSASLAEQPAAVVSLSAPASFGPLRALPAVARLHAPVFFAAAADDQPFADDARALYRASGSAERALEIRPGAAHGEDLLQDAAFRARVTAFIDAH